MLDEIPEDGRARANGPIRRELAWDNGRYQQVKDALIRQGLIERARGYGGAVKRHDSATASVTTPAVPAAAGWTADEAALFNLIPEDGDTIGNQRLRTMLGWDEDRYWGARDALLDREDIGRGRGKGGSVYRLFDADPEEEVEGDEAEADIPEAYEESTREIDLYEPFADYLRYRARDELALGEHFLVQVTAHQGRRQTGGRWTRPDLVLASRPRFKHVPDRRIDLQSFELKLTQDAISGVYETVAHSRNVHRAYLAVCTADDTEWTDSADYSRVKAECERLSLGLIVFDDPQDSNSYETVVDAPLREPEPSDLDDFIDTQLSEENRDRLRSWFT